MVTAITPRHETAETETTLRMNSSAIWLAPARNLVWVAAHYGYR